MRNLKYLRLEVLNTHHSPWDVSVRVHLGGSLFGFEHSPSRPRCHLSVISYKNIFSPFSLLCLWVLSIRLDSSFSLTAHCSLLTAHYSFPTAMNEVYSASFTLFNFCFFHFCSFTSNFYLYTKNQATISYLLFLHFQFRNRFWFHLLWFCFPIIAIDYLIRYIISWFFWFEIWIYHASVFFCSLLLLVWYSDWTSCIILGLRNMRWNCSILLSY